MKKIKVLLVDDHQIILDGVKTMLVDEEDIDFIGCASDGAQALEIIKLQLPDIVISDISMPDMTGIELTSKIMELNLPSKVLILSMYTTDDYIYNAIKAGASGILPKQDTNKDMLMEAIKTISDGDDYFSSNISKNFMRSYVSKIKNVNANDGLKKFSLTAREKEILKYYVEGFSNQEVAQKLNISVRTVETHKNNIMKKFDFKSTVEMVKFALKNNIVSI